MLVLFNSGHSLVVHISGTDLSCFYIYYYLPQPILCVICTSPPSLCGFSRGTSASLLCAAQVGSGAKTTYNVKRKKRKNLFYLFDLSYYFTWLWERGRCMCILLPPTPFNISTAHRSIWFKTHICIYAITKKGISRFTDKVLPILTMFTFFAPTVTGE